MTRRRWDRKETVRRTEFEDLYESHLKAQRGVIWKGSVARFSLHGAEEVNKLVQELDAGTYKPKAPVLFTITKPKRREILAISYRDRVYQRWINDRLLYPAMTKSFVRENGACQTGKGTTYCMDVLKRNLRRFYTRHGLDGYILQIDIEHYYPSMRHDMVKAMFREKLDDQVYRMVADILDGQYEGEIGYNPGSQMVQIAGIGFLNGIDHYIKEKLRIREYVRVMDDMVLIHKSREYLKRCLEEIRRELARIGLRCHPKKTGIVPIREGIAFLGFRWRLTETGKIVLIPKPEKIKEFYRATEKLMRLYAEGKRTKQYVERSVETRLAHLSLGNTWKLRGKLLKWCKERMAYHEERKRILQPEGAVPGGEGKAGQRDRRGGGKRRGPGGCRGSAGGTGGNDRGAG